MMTQTSSESENLEQKTRRAGKKGRLKYVLGAIGLAAISSLAGFFIRGEVDGLNELKEIREKDNSIVSYEKLNKTDTLYNYKDGMSMLVTDTGVFINERDKHTSYHAHHDRSEERLDCRIGDGFSGIDIRAVKIHGFYKWGIIARDYGGYGGYSFPDCYFDLKDESDNEITNLPEFERVLATFAIPRIQYYREKVDKLKSQKSNSGGI